MNSHEFRQAAHSAIDEIIDYYESFEKRPVASGVKPGYLREMLPSKAPEDGEEWDEIQADIQSKIVPGLTHWQSPNFMAFFPAQSSFPSILGEMYSAAFSCPAFNWACSPAVTELETIVLDWLAQLLALPECFLSKGRGGAVVQGTASEAIVTVMVAARERYLKICCKGLEGEKFEDRRAFVTQRMVALGTSQTHSSTEKAARILGLRYKAIPTEIKDDFALTSRKLNEALEECKSEGLEPFYLTSTLGSTNTCAIDRFGEIVDCLQKRSLASFQSPDLWVHVDAAYAGAVLVCEEYQYLAKDFAAFDSFDVNMHKWLLTNFDASCLFVKDRNDLTSALSITPSYLRNDHSESGLVTDYRNWQIPLGRRFRSLKIWFVLRTYGASGLKAMIRNHISYGLVFHDLVKSRNDLFEVFTPPALAVTVLRIQPAAFADAPGMKRQEMVNTATKDVYEAINSAAEVYLTSSVINGQFVIRVVAASPQVEERHLRRAFDILVEHTERILGVNGVRRSLDTMSS